MRCFLKRVEFEDDRAVHGHHSRLADSVPLTIAAFSDFQIPPSTAEALLLIEVAFALCDREKRLVVCRNSHAQVREWRLDADKRLPQLIAPEDIRERKRWLLAPLYLADYSDRTELATLVSTYGNVYGDHFFVAEWPTTDEAIDAAMRCIRGPYRTIMDFRDAFFASRSMAALTFDDCLWDFYAKRAPEELTRVFDELTGSLGVPLSMSER